MMKTRLSRSLLLIAVVCLAPITRAADRLILGEGIFADAVYNVQYWQSSIFDPGNLADSDQVREQSFSVVSKLQVVSVTRQEVTFDWRFISLNQYFSTFDSLRLRWGLKTHRLVRNAADRVPLGFVFRFVINRRSGAIRILNMDDYQRRFGSLFDVRIEKNHFQDSDNRAQVEHFGRQFLFKQFLMFFGVIGVDLDASGTLALATKGFGPLHDHEVKSSFTYAVTARDKRNDCASLIVRQDLEDELLAQRLKLGMLREQWKQWFPDLLTGPQRVVTQRRFDFGVDLNTGLTRSYVSDHRVSLQHERGTAMFRDRIRMVTTQCGGEGVKNTVRNRLSAGRNPCGPRLAREDPYAPEADRLIEQGRQAESQSDFERALHQYHEAIQLRTSDPEYFIARGRMHVRLNHPDEALADFTQAIFLRVDHAGAYRGKAQVFAQQARWPAALQHAHTATLYRPADSAIWKDYARWQQQAGRVEDALTSLGRALELEPEDQVGWALKGSLHLDSSQYDQAIECFEQSLALDPEQVDLVNWLAHALYLAGEVRKSEAMIRDGLARFGPVFGLLAQSARSDLLRKDPRSALDLLEQALEAGSSDPKAVSTFAVGPLRDYLKANPNTKKKKHLYAVYYDLLELEKR